MKKTFLTVALVAAVAVASSASASTLLRVGSRGAAVSDMQKNLAACLGTPVNADGIFGRRTGQAIRTYQQANNLKVDGIVGPMTRAAIEKCAEGKTGTTTTTGTTTGTTTTGTTTTASTGKAGSITTTSLSTYTTQNVAKGAVDKMVSEFKVKASGSDVKVTALGVKMAFSGNGSARLEKYLTSVGVYSGNTKVGEISASAFTQESSSNTYSATVVFTNPVVVTMGSEQKLSIGVNALTEIDSANLGSTNNEWTATVNQVRYMDGTGTVLVDSSASPAQKFYFTNLASSVNTEAQFSLASTNPRAQSVRVDTGSNTNGVKLLDATFKAQGSDMYLDDVPVKVTVSTASGTVKVSDVVANLKLSIGGTEYSASPTATTACTTAAATASCTVIFYDVNYVKVTKDQTVPMVVTADIKNIITGTFDEGDTVKAEITSTEYTAARIEDMNRDSLTANKRTGSSIGETMTLQSKGVSLVFLSSPAPAVSQGDAANDDIATFDIKFKVTANGGDMFLARNPNTNSSITYQIDEAGTLTTGTGAVLTDNTDATTGTVTGSAMYKIANGSSEEFTLTVSAQNGSGPAALTRVLMSGLKWYFADATSVPTLTPGTNGDQFTSTTFNFSDFRTGYVSLY